MFVFMIIMFFLHCFLQLLEEDISKHQNKLQSLHEMSQDFKKKKHFMADELVDRAQKHYERYWNWTRNYFVGSVFWFDNEKFEPNETKEILSVSSDWK